jgi:hypothetical protein
MDWQQVCQLGSDEFCKVVRGYCAHVVKRLVVEVGMVRFKCLVHVKGEGEEIREEGEVWAAGEGVGHNIVLTFDVEVWVEYI